MMGPQRALAIAVLALCLAFGHALPRRALQQAQQPAPAKPAGAAQPTCTLVVTTVFKQPLCLAQYVRKDPKDPKTAAIITPTTVGTLIRSADAACQSLKLGAAVIDQSQFGSSSVKCYNGKSAANGPAWVVLACCKEPAPGADTLARYKAVWDSQGISDDTRDKLGVARAAPQTPLDPRREWP